MILIINIKFSLKVDQNVSESLSSKAKIIEDCELWDMPAFGFTGKISCNNDIRGKEKCIEMNLQKYVCNFSPENGFISFMFLFLPYWDRSMF